MSEHEQQLSHVLHRTTANLRTDTPRLVAAGMARGRRRARRRTTATSLAALAVVGATGVGVSAALPGSGPDDAAGPQFAAPVEPPAPIEPTPDPRPAIVDFHVAALAVAPGDFPATFASLLPGEVTSLPAKEADQPIVDFLWNGVAVRVGFAQEQGSTDPALGTPRERCQAQSVGVSGRCRALPDGSVAHSFRSTGPAVDGAVTTHWAQVYRDDGWLVWVTIANAADTKESPLLAEAPPLTPRQLLTVATSPVWWE